MFKQICLQTDSVRSSKEETSIDRSFNETQIEHVTLSDEAVHIKEELVFDDDLEANCYESNPNVDEKLYRLNPKGSKCIHNFSNVIL